ncbi:MAG: hypothetical protein GXO93_05835 [FCB group bacterium]|nr:hypothetical protein [FCB group bacterium]
MAAEKTQDNSKNKISEQQRFHYIGFDVFPGEPKDLFESDAEKEKYVEAIKAKREEGETIREQCTLLEDRVSFLDRLVMTIASLVIIVSLFIPWFSAYNEIVEESKTPAQNSAVMSDSTKMSSENNMGAVADSNAITSPTAASTTPTETTPTKPEQAVRKGVTKTGASEEVIHGYVVRKKIHREYSRVSAIGAILSLGSEGKYVFSSGFVLILTGIIFLLIFILCIVLPIYTLYGLFGIKGNADQKALRLKKMLRFNWIPLVLFILTMLLSFFGADYGFDAANLFGSLGKSYGPGAFLNTISWGVFISLSAFIITAAKGIEI